MNTDTNDGTAEEAAFQVEDAPDSPGAPLRRGPRALRRFCARPEVRVWAAPALRGLTLIFALSSVAMLGHAADQASHAGIRLAAEAGAAPVSLVSPSSNAERAARQRESEAPPSEGAGQEAPARVLAAPPPSACPVPPPCASPQPSAAPTSALLSDGRIVLNEATVEDFQRLPGVGQRRAQALLELRERLGGFKKLSDLLRVKGIGYKSLKKFEAVAVVKRPAEEAAPLAATVP